MVRSYENTTLCVRRGGTSKLSEAVMAKSTISEIPENHILIEVGSECYGSRRELSHLRKNTQVDKFGWSANNVTYGMLGEDPHFRYG